MTNTAEMLNYKAREGFIGKKELEEFCTVQNPLLASIRWRVVECAHDRAGTPFIYWQLVANYL